MRIPSYYARSTYFAIDLWRWSSARLNKAYQEPQLLDLRFKNGRPESFERACTGVDKRVSNGNVTVRLSVILQAFGGRLVRRWKISCRLV